MESTILDAIQNLTLAINNKSDPLIYAAIITIFGMLGTAILTTITQLKITNHLVKSDFNKMMKQIYTENQVKEHQEWKNTLRITISKLLAETDPECNPNPKKDKIIPLIHQVQLLLNTSVLDENELNKIINEFALSINGWLGSSDLHQIFSLHAKISDQTRIILQKSNA